MIRTIMIYVYTMACLYNIGIFICFMIQYAQKIFSLSSYFFELFNLFMQYWTKVMFYMYRLVANNSNEMISEYMLASYVALAAKISPYYDTTLS